MGTKNQPIFEASDLAASSASATSAASSASSAATSSLISTSDTATDQAAATTVISVLTKNTKLVTTVLQLGLFSLADGVDGQIKTLTMTTKGGAIAAVVTPANLNGGTIITFTTLGSSIQLIFLSTKWYSLGGSLAVIS